MFRCDSSVSRFSAAAFALTIPLLAACGGGAGDSDGGGATVFACTVPMDSIVGYSADRWIRTRVPQPHRFMIPLGTDSMLPEASQFALNTLNRGAYPWPADPAQQKAQIAAMRAKGPFVTISFFYHGTTDMPDGRKASAFSGTYHDVANDGINLARTDVYFDCKAPEGRRYITADEPPPVDTAPPAAGAPAKSGGGY